ncbi:MAG TPA: hypothetical protein VG939_00625 [Caulobacteraceae bacterium]|nr:hypothetical protein [Caulobacteraceae bacterium]
MDRARRRPGVLSAGAAAAAFATVLAAGLGAARAGADAAAAPPLKAMRWLPPGADAAAVLTRQPVECLKRPADLEGAYSVELGRAAFRTPLLLGGQAARAGVACETCHRNGRTNASFDFPGLSGAPGTADVTSSLFSSHRGDGVDNPKPIPDLGGPKSALKVSQDPSSGALETFIRGLVTQEFDGAEPPPAVLKGLADYVRAMGPDACPAGAQTPVTAGAALDDAARAANAAEAALKRSDAASAVVMVQAARSALGAVYERYPGPALAEARARLEVADADLRAVEDAARSGDRSGAYVRLVVWRAGFDAAMAPVRTGERASLYDRAVLARARSAKEEPGSDR